MDEYTKKGYTIVRHMAPDHLWPPLAEKSFPPLRERYDCITLFSKELVGYPQSDGHVVWFETNLKEAYEQKPPPAT